ncbi:MAG: hypothetical protein JO291_13070 [Acidimicrobiia bacterium]|nr:hypothetical protein [Acidimicrobiia bacterium]
MTSLGAVRPSASADETYTPPAGEVVLYWIAAAVILLVFESLVIAAAAGHDALGSVIGVPVGLAIAGGVLSTAYRASTTRLVVQRDRIVIRNPIRTHELSRSALVSVVASGKWIAAVTTENEAIRIWAVSGGLQWTLKRRAAEWNTRATSVSARGSASSRG